MAQPGQEDTREREMKARQEREQRNFSEPSMIVRDGVLSWDRRRLKASVDLSEKKEERKGIEMVRASWASSRHRKKTLRSCRGGSEKDKPRELWRVRKRTMENLRFREKAFRVGRSRQYRVRWILREREEGREIEEHRSKLGPPWEAHSILEAATVGLSNRQKSERAEDEEMTKETSATPPFCSLFYLWAVSLDLL